VRTDEADLLRALDILETSREARLAEMATFALRRTAEKSDRRTVSADEYRYRHGWRWPGPDAHEAMHRTVEVLWAQHERLPFPEVPPADKADLVMLDSTIAGCIWTYLRRGGELHPDHRDILRLSSYWNCYHRSAYPRLREYPGYLLVSALRAASA
jgi:hypothetical protein